MKIQRFSNRFLIISFVGMLTLAGCASTYYKVWDPVSRNAYYTEKIEQAGGGAVKLKDARTGNTVTLQNSEVKEISSEAYKEGLAAPPTPAAAPAATPAAAPEPTQNAAPAQAPAAPAAPSAPAPAAEPTPAPK